MTKQEENLMQEKDADIAGKAFDAGRFKKTVWWIIMSGRRSHIRMTAGLAVGMAMLYLFAMTPYMGAHPDAAEWGVRPYVRYRNTMCEISSVVLLIVMIYGAGNIFGNMKTKQSRLTFLMLPASGLEKYLARLFDVTVMYFLCFVAAFVAADIIQLVFSFALTKGCHYSVTLFALKGGFITHSHLYSLWSAGGISTVGALDGFAMYVMPLLWLHSSYVLGGTFFRRNHLLLTTCVHFAVGLVMSIVFIFMASNIDFILFLEENVYNLTGGLQVRVLTFLFFLFFVLDHLAAYKLSTRMQVINKKWTNV